MEKILLIDGNSILNRAFYGYPELIGKDGFPIQGVYGFLNMMNGYIESQNPNYFGIAFDLPIPTFRHIEYKEYKGTRHEAPNGFVQNIKIVEECLSKLKVCTISYPGYEADDILGTLSLQAKQNGYKTIIVSGDKDILQLVDDKIHVLLPKTVKGENKTKYYGTNDFENEFHFKPIELTDYKGLMGDTSDNIPGIKGIGKKTAQKIITEYHTIENAFLHADEMNPKRYGLLLKEHYEDAVFSKKIATIIRDVPIKLETEFMKIPEMNEETKKLLTELGIYEKVHIRKRP